MFRSITAALLLLTAVLPLTALTARAQAPALSDPADAAASVPRVIYESSIARYRAFADQEVAPWKDSNDTAGQIGGWRVYAREARQTQAAEGAAQAENTPPPKTNPAPGAAKPSAGDAARGGHEMH